MLRLIKQGTQPLLFILPISFFSCLLITGGKAPASQEMAFKQVMSKAALDSAREHNRLILNQIEQKVLNNHEPDKHN